jgi:hypothetical protein
MILHLPTKASVMRINLLDAVKKNILSVNAFSNGGHLGECLSLDLKNRTRQNIEVYIEPGLIFVCSDTNMQDLIAVGDMKVTIKPRTDTTLQLQAFCGKSYAHSPNFNISYRFERLGDPKMVSVLKFIKEKKLYDVMGQSAVWMFTNNHSFSRVYDYSRPDLSNEFLQHISKITGKAVPEYHIKTKKPITNKRLVYNNEVEESYVDISWNFTAKRNLHIAIYNIDGSFHKVVRANEAINKDGHKVIVRFSPMEYKHGSYIVRLYDDDNFVYVEKTIHIEHD